ncbi:MAG: sensor histidine kinase [Nitrososphaera sp.]|uniref:sensor histidine kinase n=1 Tax=Nitrososphaera sp. TaxID=1971748 RepID=UPI003D6EBBED
MVSLSVRNDRALTEMLYGAEKAVGRGIEFMSNAKKRMDIYFDTRGASIVVEIDAYRKGYEGIRKRGGRIRAITDITKENIRYCKRLAGMVDELRHLSDIKGGIAVTEGEYMATTVLAKAKPLTEVIYSNVPEMVRQGQYIFDAFWEKAIPASERIREIEEGIKPEFIETIKDPVRIQALAYDILKGARKEVLIMFSTANAFQRQERAGALKLLTKEIEKVGITAKILTPFSDEVRSFVERLARQPQCAGRIVVQHVHPASQTTTSLLVVDSTYSLAVEVKDDTKETSIEAMGLATFSNSKATVQTYVSIFNTLWKQAQLYEQLEVHDRMQKEFIDIAAHELRSPMQPIIGMSEILLHRITDEQNRELVNIIIRNAERLRQLSENILDVTRIESRSLQMHKESFDVNQVIGKAVEDARSLIVHRDRLRISFAPKGCVSVNADRARIAQVIYNLLDNAIKFTKEGTILPSAEVIDGFAIVSIRDSGRGIDPEIFPTLFSKFASKSEKGTGLGLFIAKSVVQSHGGKIWARNNENGKGATFAFSLPVA